MANASKYMNDINPVHTAITAAIDIIDATPTTDIINLENWTECFFIFKKDSGGTGTATITVESCDDVTPTTATAIAFQYRIQTTVDTWGDWTESAAAGFGTEGTDANQLYQIRINSESLSGDDKYVRMVTTELVNGAVVGSISCFLAGPRYSQETPASVIV